MIRTAIILFGFTLSLNGNGQSLDNDLHYFDSLIGFNNLGLISGYEYQPPQIAKESHPFFESANWLIGEISYQGVNYKNVPLKYDLYNQKIVVQKILSRGLSQAIVLSDRKISSFTLMNKSFKKISDTNTTNYYQVHLEGDRVSFYEYHIKKQRVDQTTYQFNYIPDNQLIIAADNKLLVFKNKSSILNLFENHKKSIKGFIRGNKLKIKESNIPDIKTLLKYCERL